MGLDSLIIFCDSEEQGLLAQKSLSKQHDLQMFFIFDCSLVERPEWMHDSHDYLSLDDIDLNTRNGLLLAIRASVLLSGGWGFIFCFASKLPDMAMLDKVRLDLNTRGYYKGSPDLWATTREQLIIKGFDAALHPVEQPDIMAIHKAMSGGICTPEVAYIVCCETMPLQNIRLEAPADDKHYALLQRLANQSQGGQTTTTILLPSNTDNSVLVHKLSTLNQSSAVLIIVDSSLKDYAQQAYRTIVTTEGWSILLFRGFLPAAA